MRDLKAFGSCPTGCGRQVKTGHLMCAACRRRVPGALASEVHRTWRAWRRDFGNADLLNAYRAASDAATEAATR